MNQIKEQFRRATITYALYGALFGLTFPIAATLFEILYQKLPFTFASILQTHKTQPLHWIVDTAPLVLGLIASIAGSRQDKLTQVNQELEDRVADRTRDIETSLAVGRELSTILDQRRLVAETVNLVQKAFNYYHVHVYLLDESSENLVMAGGTGEAGLMMLADNHKIPVEKGLVGRALATNEVVLISDVKLAPDWLPNALLPETKAEISVPIGLGDELMGVLDVQHNVRGGLNESDARLLEAVAHQVASALRNARLFEEARHQAEREARINAIGQEIQKATDIETVLQTAVRELSQTLDVPRVTVVLDQHSRRQNKTNNLTD